MSSERQFGIIVYGATGYTGRLVCEYLNNSYGSGGDFVWAMAGRSQEKLEAVRDEMGLPADIPLVVADAADSASMQSLAASTQVVLTTVGPYQLYGNELLAACVDNGTDYVDLCGEPAWMHEKIAAHAEQAKQSGARIVFSCGFDSIPFDLGVYFLQQQAKQTLGSALPRVRGRVRAMKGTFSGGTQASFKATMAAAAQQPELIQVLMDPFSLCAGFRGPEQPHGMKPLYEEDLDSWSAPFVMATINTKNVHRSNTLLGHDYGEDFVYDEMMFTGPGEQGEAAAKAVAADKSMSESKLKPGEGPSKEEREAGFYDVQFIGTDDQGNCVKVGVKGDKDPGYGSTCKMIAESAVCLLKYPDLAGGGVWTPAAALGSELIERLQARAGLSFSVE